MKLQRDTGVKLKKSVSAEDVGAEGVTLSRSVLVVASLGGGELDSVSEATFVCWWGRGGYCKRRPGRARLLVREQIQEK
jgi:hypothetical protein